MRKASGRIFFFVIVPACLAAVLFWIFGPFPHGQGGPGQQQHKVSAAPVEVAPIQQGTIELLRTFSGMLEPRAEFVVAPKVSGRVEWQLRW